MTDTLWYLQAISAAFSLVIFAYLMSQIGPRNYRRQPEAHAIFVLTALAIISFGNVMTTLGLAANNSGAVIVGGTLVRGSLFVTAIYLLAYWRTHRHIAKKG